MYPIFKETFEFDKAYDLNHIIKQEKLEKSQLKYDSQNFNKPYGCAINISMNAEEHKIDPETVERIKNRILKQLIEEQEQGNILSVNIQSNIVNEVSIEEGFQEFIKYKEPDVSADSIKSYKTYYKYLLFFCDKNKTISSFTNDFFADMNNKMLNFPQALTNHRIYKNSKYDYIMDQHKDKEYKTLSNKKINSMFRFYKNLFDYFEIRQYHKLEKNPVIFLNLKEKTDNYIPFNDFELQVLTQRIKDPLVVDFIYIAAFSGMRIQEISCIKKKSIDLNKKLMYIDRSITKTNAGVRVIPIHPKIFNIVETYYHESPAEFAFTPKGNKNIMTKKISNEINKLVVNPYKTFHSLRKNFTQQLYKERQLNNTIQEQTIHRLLGHGDQNITFDIYNLGKIEEEILIKAVESVSYGDIL